MKHLLRIILLIGFQHASAQVFDKETIKNFENDDKRINLVILSDGYQVTELAQFKTDAVNFTNTLFNQSPFKEYANYFNVHILKVPSNESGADHPGTAIDVTEPKTPVRTVDTYFNATFDSYGYHRLLYYEIDGNAANNTQAKTYNVLADNYPTYDQGLILVNSTVYGGSGGEFPMASKGVESGVSAVEVAIHELGHSFANLKDEYFPLDEIYFNEAINMTQESNPSFIKWKNWLNGNGIGIYQYNTTGYAANWYRPHQACKMRYLGYPFCSVCKEGIIEKIHSLVSPIDSYTPVSNTINSPSFPIDFHLNLIKPNPNTLKSKWTLNALDFANDVDDVSILETDLNTGMNTLTVAVNDATGLLKVDNHDSFHVYTVTWTIDNSALGIKDITSEMAKYHIAMYPNPTSTLVNFAFESDKDAILKIDIVSLDGKKIKTVLINNYQTNEVDISHLSTGIYLANFYTGTTLIASKKLVKN
ncbi:M64 family metallopeptidase [Mariniflexile gromovii]|uniref:T9SS type A sorting domain-containing protein n=1 Tax=Mariniflexile gromovii TaxID=362523 RepID=A0ABS4BTV6_9FLAO|nr:M64 family metallopeptidase [Mariniflexile gromovii]MBP0903446.1 T9SS type A sorting domain-containing protein [Mariniflexile gromovii]